MRKRWCKAHFIEVEYGVIRCRRKRGVDVKELMTNPRFDEERHMADRNEKNILTVPPPANSTLFSEIGWQLEIGSEQRSWTCFVSLSVHFQHPWTEQWLCCNKSGERLGHVTGDSRDSLLLVSFFLYVSRAFKTSSLTVGWTAWEPTREVASGPIVDILDHLGQRRECQAWASFLHINNARRPWTCDL